MINRNEVIDYLASLTNLELGNLLDEALHPIPAHVNIDHLSPHMKMVVGYRDHARAIAHQKEQLDQLPTSDQQA